MIRYDVIRVADTSYDVPYTWYILRVSIGVVYIHTEYQVYFIHINIPKRYKYAQILLSKINCTDEFSYLVLIFDRGHAAWMTLCSFITLYLVFNIHIYYGVYVCSFV